MSIISGANAVTGAGAVSYQIERSLRFNSADSAYLNRTPASAGNRKTWTWSGWVKRSALSSTYPLFMAGSASTDYTVLAFNSNDVLYIANIASSANAGRKFSSAVYRDVSAWYHVVAVFDTDNATANDRMILYVNGSRITALSVDENPSSGQAGQVNNNVIHTIGRNSTNTVQYFNGYLTEINFIDGQALDPTSFGEYNSETGVWQPKAYTGSYGTNGFYLDFADNSSTTALGYDAAGSNDWTPNNFSVTAGTGNDSLVDTPTPYGTDTGVGGEVRGNYATLNPLQCGAVGNLSNGNLQYTTLTNNSGVTGTIDIPVGEKVYIESNLNHPINGGEIFFLGVANQTTISGYLTANRGGCLSSSGSSFYGIGVENQATVLYIYKSENGVATTINTSYPLASSSVVAIAVDRVANDIELFIDGVSVQTLSIPSSGTLVPYIANAGGSSLTTCFQNVNFGQRPFAYTAPSGFAALCTQNLPEPTVVDGGNYFNAVLWTGNSSASQAVTGVGFQPDLVWAKSRPANSGQDWVDSVRGATKNLQSSSTAAETTSNTVISFQSDGFTVGDGLGYDINKSGESVVGWCWKAGGTGVTNTAGTITSTVSANTTAGFSVVTWTNAGNGDATVGHGLGVAPKFIITKKRSTTNDWYTYTTIIDGSYDYLSLNTTNSKADSVKAAPTSTVFTTDMGDTSTAVAYCFAPVAGYSAFGSYTGNGSTDGVFVYTGFAPRYILIKNASYAGTSWEIFDTARQDYNQNNLELLANSTAAEGSYTFGDILSNGFKLRSSNNGVNRSGDTLIYAAFASNPFRYSLAR